MLAALIVDIFLVLVGAIFVWVVLIAAMNKRFGEICEREHRGAVLVINGKSSNRTRSIRVRKYEELSPVVYLNSLSVFGDEFARGH